MAEDLSLSELARAVWQRKRMVALIVIGCVAAAGVATRLLPKIYRAQTSVFFPQSSSVGVSTALGGLGQNPGVLAGLGITQPAGAAQLCKAIAESYSVRAEICRDFDLKRRLHAQSFQDAADKLRDSTWADITPDGLLVIRVDSTDARLCADLANAYGRIVERRYDESSLSRARGERQFLEARVAQAEKDLQGAEAQLKAYRERAGAVIAPEQIPPVLQKLSDLRVEQAQAEVELEAMRQRRADASSQLDRLAAAHADGKSSRRSPYEVPWENSSETISDNPDIAALRAELVSREVQLAAARHNLTDEHPDVKRLRSQIEETRSRLASEARKTLTAETRTRNPVYAAALEDAVKLATAVMGQEARTQGLAELVKRMEADAASLPEQLLQYSRLAREVRAKEAVYTTLTSQLEGAKLKELQEQPVFEVLDRAVVPERHDRPKLLVNVAVGFVLGAFLALAIAAALGPPRRISDG